MIITELEIINALGCEYVKLEFPSQQANSSVLMVQSKGRCDVISTAIQLVCSARFAEIDSLKAIKDKLSKGKVTITFLLPNIIVTEENGSDSEITNNTPCTSKQAQERHIRRKKSTFQNEQKRFHKLSATRDFYKNPLIIEHTLNNGAVISTSVEMFHITFFNAVDYIMPSLSELTYSDHAYREWINILPFGKEEDDLLTEFSLLYDCKKIDLNHLLKKLTTITLMSRSGMHLSRISCTLQVFLEVRRLFEYITCSEYTVWFLLPIEWGRKEDLSKITQNIDFEQIETVVQLKTKNSSKSQVPWLKAERHIQELLMVSIELAFAYHCQQKLMFLHNLENLNKHQNFELFNSVLACSQGTSIKENWFSKHYLQRIVDVCLRLGITTVIEFYNGLPFPPEKASIVKCEWQPFASTYNISVSTNHQFQSHTLHKFLHVMQDLIK